MSVALRQAAPDPANAIRRPRDVAICLTPFALLPDTLHIPITDDRRWVRSWSTSAVKPMGELLTRLKRSAHNLSVRDQPKSGDVEILGRAEGYPDPVPLALVAHGLTAEDCREALRELAR